MCWFSKMISVGCQLGRTHVWGCIVQLTLGGLRSAATSDTCQFQNIPEHRPLCVQLANVTVLYTWVFYYIQYQPKKTICLPDMWFFPQHAFRFVNALEYLIRGYQLNEAKVPVFIKVCNVLFYFYRFLFWSYKIQFVGYGHYMV